MEYRKLGRSGLTVSAVGLGCNNFGMRIDADQARDVVHAALDAGVTFFDTANIYGGRGASEEMLGKALGDRRDEVVISTKFGGAMGDGPYDKGASRRHITRQVEDSLRRLGTDRIDLYHQHWPDAETPVEETLEALTDLVRAGKVLYLANSNFASWQLAEADHTSRERGLARFTGAQIEWNMLNRDVEREIVPACAHYGLGVIPYFPLASGLLSGKYRRGEDFPEGSRFAAIPYFAGQATDDNWARVERLTAYADDHGRTLLELAMSWLASQPVVASVIAGATRPDQVRANADAAGWRLTAEQLAEIDELLA